MIWIDRYSRRVTVRGTDLARYAVVSDESLQELLDFTRRIGIGTERSLVLDGSHPCLMVPAKLFSTCVRCGAKQADRNTMAEAWESLAKWRGNTELADFIDQTAAGDTNVWLDLVAKAGDTIVFG